MVTKKKAPNPKLQAPGKSQIPSSKEPNCKWNVGDWVFSEFRLKQVKEIRNGHVCDCSDGYVRGGSSNMDEEIFPLDLSIKLISDNFKHWSDRIHKEGNRALNFPDIHRWFRSKWEDACRAKDDHQAVDSIYSELETFGNAILKRSTDLKFEEVSGVRIMQ